MTRQKKSAHPKKEHDLSLPPSLTDLAVVERCSELYLEGYKEALAENKEEEHARAIAKNYYRTAMPAPFTPDSTHDFIACVTFGVLVNVFSLKEANALYYAAQVASSVSRKAGRAGV